MKNLSVNTEKTKALLIGISDYANLSKIKPAKNNIAQIAAALMNEHILGLPQKNIIQIIDKRNDEINGEICDFLDDENNIDVETLIFYYVGHGIRDAFNKELYLTGTNSRRNTLATSGIPFSTIKNQIENAQIQSRVVFLDACHSGVITMGDEQDEINIRGSYTITSAAGDEPSFFDPEQDSTYFTAALVKALEGGMPVAQPVLSLENIYKYLKDNVKQSTPQRKSNLNTGDFYLFRNAQYDVLQIKLKEADELYEDGSYEAYKAALSMYIDVYVERSTVEVKAKIDACRRDISIIEKARKREKNELQLREERERQQREQQMEKERLMAVKKQEELENERKRQEADDLKKKQDAIEAAQKIQEEKRVQELKEQREAEQKRLNDEAAAKLKKQHEADVENDRLKKIQEDEIAKRKQEQDRIIALNNAKSIADESGAKIIAEQEAKQKEKENKKQDIPKEEHTQVEPVTENPDSAFVLSEPKKDGAFFNQIVAIVLGIGLIIAIIIVSVNMSHGNSDSNVSKIDSTAADPTPASLPEPTTVAANPVTVISTTATSSVQATTKLTVAQAQHYFDMGMKEQEKQNYQAALNNYKVAAENGHKQAQKNVGIFYAKGVAGVPQDGKQALIWFNMANDYLDIGDLYYYGCKGVSLDYSLALYWYKKNGGADKGAAEYKIGNMYEKGEGTEPNSEHAIYWYQRAYTSGFTQANNELKRLGQPL